MKRKLPKNQRPYPKLKKLRLTEVHGAECQLLIDSQGDIGVPHLYTVDNFIGLYLAEADQMRKWRGSRVTSNEKQS